MPKQLLFDEEARRSLKRGVDKMADAVKVTLGPRGRYALLDKKFGSPTITNDGVTIARDIELEEPDAQCASMNGTNSPAPTGYRMAKFFLTKPADTTGQIYAEFVKMLTPTESDNKLHQIVQLVRDF